MNKIPAVFILLLILFTNTYPQHPVNISKYYPYLPEKLSSDSEFMQSVQLKMEQLVKIEPRLIYFYLKHLDAYWNKKITNNDSNYITLLNYNKNRYLMRKSEWRHKNLPFENRSWNSMPLEIKIAAFYPDYDEADIQFYKNTIILEVDTNKVYYFSQLLFQESESQAFDPAIDYKEKYVRCVKTKISNIENSFNNTSEVSDDSLKTLYKENLKYWYLFDEISLADFNITNSVDPRKILYDRFRDDYSEKPSLSFSIFTTSATAVLSVSSNYEYFYKEITKTIANEDQYYNLFSFEVKYSLPLKKVLSALSHLEFGLGYNYGSDFNNKKENQELYSYYGVAYGKNVIKGCSFSSASSSQFHSFSAGASTPVYFYNKNLFIVIGFEMTYSLLKIKGKLNYYDKIEYTIYPKIEIQDNNVFIDKSENLIKVFPLLEIHAGLKKDFDFVIKFNNSIQAGFKYSFALK